MINTINPGCMLYLSDSVMVIHVSVVSAVMALTNEVAIVFVLVD